MSDDAAYKALSDMLMRSSSGSRYRLQVIDAIRTWFEANSGGGGGGGFSLWEIKTINASADVNLTVSSTKTLVLVDGVASIAAAYAVVYLPKTGLEVGQEIIFKMEDTVQGGKNFLIGGSNPLATEIDNGPFLQDVIKTVRDSLHLVWTGSKWVVVGKRVFSDD